MGGEEAADDHGDCSVNTQSAPTSDRHSEGPMRFTVLLSVTLIAVSAQAASPIGQALSCGRVGSAGGLGGGTDLQRITVDTTRFREAVCNDGSPAVFYAARYTADAD